MPGAFHGINMASNALRMFQRALDTTGNNIANVNTRGFSRQTVDFAQQDPLTFYSQGWRSLGGGVTISQVNRIRDLYLEARARESHSDQGRLQTMSQGLSEALAAFGEPGDSGVSAAMDGFFNAWNALGSNPTEAAARAQVRNAGRTLTDRIRDAFSRLETLQTDSIRQVETTVGRINELGAEIAELNRQIRQYTQTDGNPNALLDRRDLAVQELAKLTDVTVVQLPDFTYGVYASGVTLVDSAGARTFPSTLGTQPGTVTDGLSTFPVRSGELAGLMQLASRVGSEMAQLDLLANELRNQFNTLHRAGNNNAGIDFFNEGVTPPDPAQGGARTFGLSADVLNSLENVMASATGLPSDGGLARQLAGLRSAVTGLPGAKTFESFYRDNLNVISNDAAYYSTSLDSETAVLEQISNQQQAISGVSLDEEMANMLRFQRSFQAAARALSVFDQMTEDLIGMLR